jgi:DDE family transposase/transposase-like protein DUF772
MFTKRSSQVGLYDVGNVWPLKLPAGSFFGQLAGAADRLFKDEEFICLYCSDNGRPCVPPSQLALMLVMQSHDMVSDAEAIEKSAYDLRWCAVLRRHAGEALCAKSTLQVFRAQLVLHDQIKQIFKKSVQEAKRVGLLKGKAMRVAIDTKPIEGRGAIEDTYNLLATGIGLLADALAKKHHKKKADWLKSQGLGRYTEPSVKGTADIDWSDKAAKERFLTIIVDDARKVLSLADGQGPAVKEAAELLEKLLLQDVEEGKDESGAPHAAIKEGTAPARIPSATDPQVRHGRKSKSKRFNGHKASVVTEVDSGIIVALDVLPGDSADSSGALQMMDQAEENADMEVAETLGDCAYGSGATRKEFHDAGRTLHAKAAQEGGNNGLFKKSEFTINLRNWTATCPGGHTTDWAVDQANGGVIFYFDDFCGGCPLRARCTTAAQGRSLAVHPHEALLRNARKYQRTRKGRANLRKRVIVENSLARLAHLGIGQARYKGRTMTRFQLAMTATVANLRRSWNWVREQSATMSPDGAQSGATNQVMGACAA